MTSWRRRLLRCDAVDRHERFEQDLDRSGPSADAASARAGHRPDLRPQSSLRPKTRLLRRGRALRRTRLDPRTRRASGAVMVDMAGNGEVVAGVHERLADDLKYSCTVGGTHWESKPRPKDLPGPTAGILLRPRADREAHPGLGRRRTPGTTRHVVASLRCVQRRVDEDPTPPRHRRPRARVPGGPERARSIQATAT